MTLRFLTTVLARQSRDEYKLVIDVLYVQNVKNTAVESHLEQLQQLQHLQQYAIN